MQYVTRLAYFFWWGVIIIGLGACGAETPPDPVMPTAAATSEVIAAAETAVTTETTGAPTIVPATWTPAPTLPPPPTSTPLPTITAVPSGTPAPIPTNTPIPTKTPVPPTNTPVPAANTPAAPAPTAVPPTVAPERPLGENILTNPSFEGGWYNKNGIPELQLPNGWGLDWDEGPTGFGDQEWDVFVRPETRVLPASQLPPAEHSLYIYDGQYTIKIFKGAGAISFRFYTDMPLSAGTYQFEIKTFPDLVMDYTPEGEKIWAGDPFSGEIMLFAGNQNSGWKMLNFGQRNTLTYVFTVEQDQTVRVGIWGRGRYALANNGFFFDDWSLRRVQ